MCCIDEQNGKNFLFKQRKTRAIFVAIFVDYVLKWINFSKIVWMLIIVLIVWTFVCQKIGVVGS